MAEPALSVVLQQRAEEIEAAFASVEAVLRRLAPRQFEGHFAQHAQRELGALGIGIEAGEFASSWSKPLNLGLLHARCVIATFCNLVEREFDRTHALVEEGEDAESLIRRFGFHGIDITSCADGRLGGVVDFILRVPPAIVVAHSSYAGAMFDVEAALHQWEALELRRWRLGVPNDPTEPTRYLKVGVYHFSSVDPAHQGCAAHGSDQMRAASALLCRLEEFAGAVESTHGDATGVATLLIGVDTDTDAIRVHVPDAAGVVDVTRFLSSADLYGQTAGLERDAAKAVIRLAVAECTGVDANDQVTEGMRWLCGYLLKNNISQVDAVRANSGGRYSDSGHAEKLIVIGDPIDDVQLRNLAFQVRMDTVEEGAGDLDVGLAILAKTHTPQGLAIPLLIHVVYDERIPSARDRAVARARRLGAAIKDRYGATAAAAGLVVQATVRAENRSSMELVAPRPKEARG
ncbi:MAG: carboxysome shell carbonic anhydrase [Microbacterium sp.]|nr:carboxysome shell carbonic anhydrase [Microbacterium sp.]